MDEIVIQGFEKNSTTVVVCLLNEQDGQLRVHVREMKATVSGDWMHGRGVFLDTQRVWELVDGVRRLTEVATLDQVVAKIPVGKNEIRVGVGPYKGNQYAFVREFYPDGDGGWLPSPRGVNVRTDLIDR